MKKNSKMFLTIALLTVCTVSLLMPDTAICDSRRDPKTPYVGIYLDLTEEYYRALKEDSRGTRTYSSNQSEEYLRQIAISSKFIVETNLQLLRQQEKMLQLLEEMKDDRR